MPFVACRKSIAKSAEKAQKRSGGTGSPDAPITTADSTTRMEPFELIEADKPEKEAMPEARRGHRSCVNEFNNLIHAPRPRAAAGGR